MRRHCTGRWPPAAAEENQSDRFGLRYESGHPLPAIAQPATQPRRNAGSKRCRKPPSRASTSPVRISTTRIPNTAASLARSSRALHSWLAKSAVTGRSASVRRCSPPSPYQPTAEPEISSAGFCLAPAQPLHQLLGQPHSAVPEQALACLGPRSVGYGRTGRSPRHPALPHRAAAGCRRPYLGAAQLRHTLR